MPVNNTTLAEGIVQLPENTELRTRSDGFVDTVHAQDGDPVEPGDLLITLANPELKAREAILAGQSRALDLRYNEALSGEPVELALVQREREAIADELKEVREQLGHLQVHSDAAGILALTRANDLPGRFLHKGDLIGHVVNRANPSVQVVLTQGQVDRVSQRTREIEVRLASRPGETVAGLQPRDLPKATNRLPSALLGTSAGGDIPVDAREGDGRLATRPVFQLEIDLPTRPEGPYLGQRAYIRFEHLREPVGRIWYREIRRGLLENLGF